MSQVRSTRFRPASVRFTADTRVLLLVTEQGEQGEHPVFVVCDFISHLVPYLRKFPWKAGKKNIYWTVTEEARRRIPKHSDPSVLDEYLKDAKERPRVWARCSEISGEEIIDEILKKLLSDAKVSFLLESSSVFVLDPRG